MIKAVLFDVDGTLIESKDMLLKAFNLALVDIGEEPVDESVFEIAKQRQLGTISYYVNEVLKKPEKKVAMYAAHMTHYCKILQEEVKLIPGTEEVFRVLREKGIKIGIHTMQYRAMVDIVLNKFQLNPDASVAHEEVENRKPAPDQILKLCQELTIDPSFALVVGDWTGDIKAGKAAGTKTLGVLSGLNTEEELKGAFADKIVKDLTMIPEIIDSF